MITPSVSDFGPDVDSHLFVSISLTSLSNYLFGYCPCKTFSSKHFAAVLVLDL